jgi:ABC-2 type transport system permease protein
MKKSRTPCTIKPRRNARSIVLSVMVTLAVILCVILINILAGNLETRYSLRKDFSFNRITTQSGVTDSVLKSLDKDVRIYMLFTAGQEDTALAALIARYSATSSHVTSSAEDVTKNPLFLTMLSDELNDSAVSGDCVVIHCDQTGRTRVLSGQDYLAYGYDADTGNYSITGLTYEKSITEALVYVTRDEIPVLQILTGHGELAQSETGVLEKQLTTANYTVSRINLLAGDKLNPDSLLLILSPLKDITDIELARINDFTAAGGSLLITSDYNDPAVLPNINTVYRSYGFTAIPGIVVADKSDPSSFYNDSPAILIPDMLASDATGVLVTAEKDMLVLAGVRAFETPGSADPNLRVQTVLKSGETSYIRAYDDAVMSLDRRDGDRSGSFSLALLADLAKADGTHSRAFIIGNSSLFLEDWMSTYTYSKEFLLQIIQYLQGKPPINLDIIPKEAIRPPLAAASSVPASVTLVLLPVLVLIAALAVLLPRKNL